MVKQDAAIPPGVAAESGRLARCAGYRLEDQRGPKQAHSIAQYVIRRRFISHRTAIASSKAAAASPAAVRTSIAMARIRTSSAVNGGLPVSCPVEVTQTLTTVPAGAPGLAGTRPDLTAPDGACHRPGTQTVRAEL